LKKRVTKKSTAPARTKAKAKAPAKAKPRQYHKKVIKPAAETVDQIFESLASKQQLFIVEYMKNGFNGTKAARKVGYAARNADTQASRMLATPKIRAVIDARKQKMIVKREITAERVLDEIAKLAFFDPRRLYNEFGSLIPVQELDEDVAAAVASVGTRELYAEGQPFGVLKNIKFADKGQNLERLGRYLKLFTDRVEHGADKDFMVTIKSILSGGK
jgi:phage terminase small subunit